MAGSLRWFDYISDDGSSWAIFADESNIEAINGNANVTPGLLYKPPANLKPRYAVYANEAGTRNIKIVVLTQANYNALTPATIISDPFLLGGQLQLVRKRPELITPTPKVFDTGLDDGDIVG